MNDDMLSPSEIEALLKGEISEERNEDMLDSTAPDSSNSPALTLLEQKTLNELSGYVLGSLTANLTSLLQQHAEITVLETAIVHQNQLPIVLPEKYAAVSIAFAESFTGTSLLMIEETNAEFLARAVPGNSESNGQLLEHQMEALQKSVQQSTKLAADFTSRFLGKPVNLFVSPVSYLQWESGEKAAFQLEEEWLVQCLLQLKAGEQMTINLTYLLPLSLVKELAESAQKAVHLKPLKQQEDAKFSEARQITARAAAEPFYAGGNVKSEPASAHIERAVFSSFQQQQSFNEKEVRNLNMLFDIPLQVTVELGRTSRSVKEILEWTAGSIIELDKLAGEPVDILVNNKLVAKGEVVVIDESFGVRITTIASPTDRLKNIN